MSNLKDIKVKEVTIVLDKERHLRYDLNAYAELEDKYGSVEVAMQKLEKGSIKAIRATLWAGLVWEDPDLTEQMVGKMLNLDSLQPLSDKVNEAMTAYLPEKGDVAELPNA